VAQDFDAALAGLATGPARSSVENVGAPQDESALPAHPSIDAARERFGDAVLRHEVHAGDEHVMFVNPARVLEVVRWLKTDAAHHYDFLADLTAVDYGGGRPIQVVYQLWSIQHKRQLRVKAELPLDALEIDSVAPLWRTADWLEREVYDLFGIQFRGHPDMRRILMPENYEEGHPLRKDFPLRGRFSRAEQTRRALEMDVEDFYIPQELEFMDEADQTTEDPHGNAGNPGPGMGGIAGG
jgi:NADH-quinone oxidoreductase subunit C